MNRIVEKFIPKEVLEDLYLKKKLSTLKIAKIVNCGKSAIHNKLKKYGINTRNHSESGKVRTDFKERINLPTEKLKELYHDKKLSMQQIADIYGVNSSLINKRFKKYNINSRSLKEGIYLSIPRRSKSISKSLIKYPRHSFSGDLLEKSYLFGFAMGDLYVTKKKYGENIIVQTSTTKKDQLDLVDNLFNKYTHIRLFKSKFGQYNIHCNLDNSFAFLLDYKQDKIPEWVLNEKTNFLSFLGGYIDAEGYFGIYNNVGVFIIGSYDKEILFGITNTLMNLGIVVEGPKLTTKEGHIDKRGVRWHGDVWEIRIRRMRELYKFISLIKNYVKHKKRYDNMISVENNLLSRTYRIKLSPESSKSLNILPKEAIT